MNGSRPFLAIHKCASPFLLAQNEKRRFIWGLSLQRPPYRILPVDQIVGRLLMREIILPIPLRGAQWAAQPQGVSLN
jgi:hypothetical protein